MHGFIRRIVASLAFFKVAARGVCCLICITVHNDALLIYANLTQAIEDVDCLILILATRKKYSGPIFASSMTLGPNGDIPGLTY